jgi:8-oxo-dGTP pyrophosphatase MutT (NUDIX family)
MPGKPPDTSSAPDAASRPPDPKNAPRARFCLAVLVNARDEILLLRRSRDDDFAPGLWGFPGGHIHEGETPEQTMRRELEEETGEEVALRTVRPIRRIGPVRDTRYGGVYEVHLFLFRYGGGSVRCNAEHDAHAWVSRDAYRSYAVVDGVDEDLAWLEVWPTTCLNANKLPRSQD